ncbi:RagB/SusD family nutrient uptake outer membrane protein [Mucilaginibacter sp. X5P1]|uniref:RagB/SusD family nutrient uptake outer membrane protein n=1 Tax=Mucilaginibacter sp. X5P1 TaxID=2723088 RepID=UPI0016217F30|nr:RagB/SusD family nutrient uptake outer membrane protein [Mucilaginibacter sp. X5P1]MBB6138301.1 hypothetical protein [Mucilaginibacter sp. X5P1]
MKKFKYSHNNKKAKILFFLLGLSIITFGCKKALDLNPITELTDAAEWKTPNDFKLGANAFYTYERTYKNAWFDYPTDPSNQEPHSDCRSDIIVLTAALNPFSNGKNTILQTDATYSGDYAHIHNINYMLAKAAAYADPASIKQYVAEAKFFRAYVYFDLLQVYGGVPLISTTLTTTSPELYAPRNTRDEIADFIISDLNAAIPDLPLQSNIASADLGRVSQGAAQGFLSRVALYEGTWQEFRGNTSRATQLLTVAQAAANSVITSAQYSLFEPSALGDSAQKYMFILENQKSNPANITKSANNEYILANRYDQTVRQINLNISHSAFADGLTPTRKFVNMYLCADGLPVDKSPLFQGYGTMNSEFINRDNRMRYNLMPAGGNYWSNAKYRIDWNGDAADLAHAAFLNFLPTFNDGYQNQKWASERNVPDNQEGYDYPVIRYAEILLNYAEATFELNGSISDADLDKSLNLVRLRVNKNMPKLSNELAAANGLDMRTEIRRERTIEFYLEGFRIDDLKRWKTAETEMPMDIQGVQWTGTQFQTTWPGASSIPKDPTGVLIFETGRAWAQKDYLLPLPQQELTLNPKLTQNPGW